MCALLCLAQIVAGAANHNVVAMLNEVANAILEGKHFRTSVHEGNAVDGETRLEGCHLEQLIEHNVGIGFALQINNDTHAIAVGFIVDIADAINSLFVYQIGNALDELCLVDTVGNLAHHNLVVERTIFYIRTRAHNNATLTSFVGTSDTLHTHDVSTRGEVGGLDILHQSLNVYVGVVDIGHAAVNNLAQIVGGHVGGHTYGNTTRTIHEEIGDARWHDGGFLQ